MREAHQKDSPRLTYQPTDSHFFCLEIREQVFTMIDPDKDIRWRMVGTDDTGKSVTASIGILWEQRIPFMSHYKCDPIPHIKAELKRAIFERVYGGQESLLNRVVSLMSDPAFRSELEVRSYGNYRRTAGIMVASKLGLYHDRDGNIIPLQSAVSVAKPGMNTGDCGLSLTVEKPSCLPSQVVEGESPSGDGA